MTHQIKCECGYVARGDSAAEVVAEIQEHIRTDHPELAENIDADDIRSWIEVLD